MFVTSVGRWLVGSVGRMSRNRKMAAIGTDFVYTCEGSRRFRCPKNMRYRQMELIGTGFVYISEGTRHFSTRLLCRIVPSGPPLPCGCYLVSRSLRTSIFGALYTIAPSGQ